MATVAHKVSDKNRTSDVLISENISFDGLLLSETVINGLKNAGFVKPSPIQLKAIPLGRCGLDLIVQAKSGTGKTCVFSVIALESICTDSGSTQVLVLAPTREIAVQIWEVIKSIGSAMKGLECHTFIGGLPLYEDRAKLKKCHIAVGSPGRIKQLIETGVLRTENIRMFILDEADKLLEEGFQEQINWIYSTLPENKQMLALSATYPEYLADHLTAYMRNPTFLRLNISDPALLGIRQYYQTVTYHPLSHIVFDEKCKILINLLSSVSFQQCLVFSNVQTRASNLADMLNSKGWPTACIAGCLDQKDRNHAMAKLKTYKCRILISTDLIADGSTQLDMSLWETARGIDADRVNMVVNMDIPKDHETYLHRIGRAGRFGAFGIAVSLVSEGQEKMNMNMIEKRCNTAIHPLPDPLPADLAKAQSPVYLNDVVSTEVISTNQSETKKPAVKANKSKAAGLSGLDVNQHKEAELTHRTETDGDRSQSGEIRTNRQEDVVRISNSHCDSVNAAENVNVKKDFTLYDLDKGTMNALHFTSGKEERDFKEECDLDPDGGKMLPTKSSTFKKKVEDSEEIDLERSNLITISSERHVGNRNNYENLSLDLSTPKIGRPLEKGNKTNSAVKSIDDNSKQLKQAQLSVATSSASSQDPGVYNFPQQSDIDLSKLFKCSIGYKKQRNTLTYNNAKQSLKEYRDNFSGLTSKPSFSISKSDAGVENEELLKVAVSQLQELFDRNLTVRSEPANTVKQKISKATQEIASSQGGAKSNQEKPKSNQEGSKSNQGICESDSILTDVQTATVKYDAQEKKRKSCVIGSLKFSEKHGSDHEVKSNGEEETDIVHVGENREVLAKSVKHNGDVPSENNQTNRRFTNRFAIAHMVQPGESVFEYGGMVRKSVEERDNYMSAPDSRVKETEDSDKIKVKEEMKVKKEEISVKEELNYVLDAKQTECVELDTNESNRFKSFDNQRNPPPLENLVLDDIGASKDQYNGYHPRMNMQIGNSVMKDETPEDSCGYREVDRGMPKAVKTSKNGSFNQSKRTNPQSRIHHEEQSDVPEEFTSDSESDSSSEYERSEYSEDTQTQDYSRHSSQDNPYRQNIHPGTSYWKNDQHLFPSPHNFYQRPLEMAPPYYQGFYRGYPPYYPQYQQALGGYPYSLYHNPHVNNYALYSNNTYSQQGNMTDNNQSFEAHMKRCLVEQQDYIKAMSKNWPADKEKERIHARNKEKKRKKSSRKKKVPK